MLHTGPEAAHHTIRRHFRPSKKGQHSTRQRFWSRCSNVHADPETAHLPGRRCSLKSKAKLCLGEYQTSKATPPIGKVTMTPLMPASAKAEARVFTRRFYGSKRRGR
jgi:hypothetical protein